MTTSTIDCLHVAEHLEAYLDKALPKREAAQIETHLQDCEACRESVRCSRAVHGLLEYVQMDPRDAAVEEVENEAQLQGVAADDGQPEEAVAAGSFYERLGAAPWWGVSATLHVLVIALASLVSMAITLPNGNEDAVIMVTELQQRTAPQVEQEKTKPELRDALSSKHDTPPTDLNSKEASDIVVPPDIIAKAEMSDHFETINPDLPDTHSALGNPEAKMFHSVEGNTEPAGGGGMNGVGLDDVVGIGGAASKGTGGGWGGGDGTGIGVGTGAGRGSFGQRGGGGRKLLVKRHGGSKATENAVDKALEWLAYHQEADGHWDAQKFGASNKCDTFCTAVAMLAFLGAGHSEKVGQWKENVQRAVGWMKAEQKPTGEIHTRLGYEVAAATMAISEAAGMANIKETRECAQKAVNYCVDIHQCGEGSEKLGWRYSPKQPGDLSVTGWFVMGLKSAKVAGLHVDPAAFEGAIKFLDSVQKKIDNPPAGVDAGYGPINGYGYTQPGAGKRTCAIGNLCRQFMGWKKEDLQGSVEYFVKSFGVPPPAAGQFDLYYVYYGTLCTFQQGGEIWKNWNEAMKAALLPRQCKDGDDAGSWTPDTAAYSKNWGRVGETAISTLCLEVYYRYLQLTPDQK
jgi:hypothetical protein